MIDLVEDEDQTALAQAAAELLASVSRAGSDVERAWSAVVDQGWLGIGVTEGDGGLGYGFVEQTLLFRELGRQAFGPSLLEVVLATATVLAGEADDRVALIGALVGGTMRVQLVETIPDGRLMLWERAQDCQYVLLLGTDSVDLVRAENVQPVPAGQGLVDTVDPEFRLRPVRWDGAGAVAHGGPSVAAQITARALVLNAALLSGNAARTRDMSVLYAKQREQYGRPIGAFQAVKHRCSDMAVRAEAAWCMTALASVGVQNYLPGHAADALSARLVAADAALVNARDNIQNHGATGFTAELTAHNLLKRAHVLATMIATTARARTALLEAEQPW